MLGVTTHTNILQRRDDIFLPEHLDTFYTLGRFHTNGGRILSRSFHVELCAGEEDREEEESECMDVDPEPVEVDTQPPEEGTIDTEVFEEDERDDVADVAMTPMADILNARNGCNNVCFYLCGSKTY